jgi:sugar O-acyltransferase (sialic acid O-acetyltransferase NeuD family)
MSRGVLLVGGGGHCRSILDSLLLTEEYDEIGIIDIAANIGKTILTVPVIGQDSDLPNLFLKGFTDAFITVGSIGVSTSRRNLFNMIEEIGFRIPNIIDPSAIISEHVELGSGIFIGKNAVINVGTKIQNGSIINTSCIIEHDCYIGDFSHIAPGSVLCGEVNVGSGAHIGANSVIKQQVKIGSNTLIGMGSTVLCDIGDSLVAYGNPCEVRGTN